VNRNFGPASQGVTRTTIKIGFWFINTDTGCQFTGVQQGGSVCNNDDVNQIEALTKYVNAHGGVAGRKLVSKIYETKVSDGQYAAQSQSVCEKLANDERVFAAVSEGQVGREFMATCLARHKTIVIDPGFWPFDNTLYRQLSPYLYQPSRARPERWVAAYIDGLAAQGFFSKGARVGLVRFDAAPYDRITRNVLKPRLARHGVTLIDEAELTTPPSLAAYGTENQQISNAILRFQSRNVDHVIFFTTLGELSVFWFQQAEAANFHPRYGMSSYEYFRQATGQSDAQFRNAVGVGWLPFFDVDSPLDPGGTATTKICASIMKEAGVEPMAGRRTHCDGIFFLKAVLDRAPALNPAGFRATVEALGSSFQPASVFGTRFGPGRYDGPSQLRYLKFFSDCGCFKYTGGLHPLP
jgi:ABC-type branched-subunit amino acid transport system substrate-binding protein